MKNQVTLFLVWSTLIWPSLASYKILGIFPHPGKSHYYFFEPLMKALAEKGHDVTIISHFPQKTPLERFTDIDISDGSHLAYNDMKIADFTKLPFQRYLATILLGLLGWTSCNQGLSHKALQDFVKQEQKFDVVMAEFFSTDCYLAIAHKLKAPLIGVSSCIVMPWTDMRMGYPSNPSYIPNPFMPFTDEMTFLERVENTILYAFHHVLFKLLIDIPGNWAARKHLGNDLPPLLDIADNASLVFANMHFSLTRPRPLVPGYIEVAGMNIRKPEKLPQNLEEWIDESIHGVIYFSLGSTLKSHTFPEEKRQMFLRAFGRLPQRVLWKWETETMPGKPDNVMIQKWMPQLDILCHPNVKAYISHGGLLGTTEGVHCGVPMVTMPLGADQFSNAKLAEASGGAVILDFESLNEESIYIALKTALEPSFNAKAKELSRRFRDRPLPPLDTAIYWVEYVAKHGGAPHMKTRAVGMPFYKYLLLDVVTFLAAISVAISLTVYLVTKAVARRVLKAISSGKIKKS